MTKYVMLNLSADTGCYAILSLLLVALLAGYNPKTALF